MRPITITQNPAAKSTTVIAASQTPSGAGNLTLAAGAAAIDSAVGGRIVGITSAGNDSGITFTITGIDQNGLSISEVVTGSSGAPGTAVSTKFYKSISKIAVSGAAAGAVTVGTVNTTLSTISQMIPLDFYHRIATQVMIEVTGTINFSVSETFDPILANGPSGAILVTPTALSSKTSNINSLLDVGATGVVVQINSYSTGATLTARIISAANSDLG